MFKKLIDAIFNRKQRKIQSFTYFIPAPPKRKTSYREKQFDKVFYEFINKGYEILSINTQANSSGESPGMWVLITVRSKNSKADALNLDEFFHEQYLDNNIETKSTSEEKIEGIYYI